MSDNHLITELRDHVANFVEEHGCYGIDYYGDVREFVPQLALTDFWTLEKITAIFCHDRNKLILHSAVDIMNHYIVVFSILVLTSGAEHLELFTQEDIKDTSLPLHSIPESYRESRHKEAFEDFLKAQWKFCPLHFSIGTNPKPSKKNLSPRMIIPISPAGKIKINPEAKEEIDAAVLYKVEFHPHSTLLTAPVVFKEYLKSGPEIQKLYDNEWAMYTQLKEDSFNHIVRYHGSFQCLDRRTIVLEYAPGGDLLSYFRKRKPPSTDWHRKQFWQNFFGLLEGLVAIDDLTRYGDQSRDTWHLKGTHQDIRPQNILICGEPSDDDYSVPFKFADMGLAHIRKVKNEGIDRFATDHFGNGMYSAPEAFRDDGGTKTIRHKSDVYSLGGILSEALIWALWGERGREAYQAERVEATREIRLKGGYHEGAFHDGDGLLTVVERWHERAVDLTGGKAEALSQLIIFVIDDSKSMAIHREQVARTCRVLTKLLKRGHVDPDKEFELFFASEGNPIREKNGTDLQLAVQRQSFTNHRCEMHTILDQVASRVIEEEQPVSIYVLTNGHWDIRTPKSICNVEKPIVRLVKHIVDNNKQSNWAMVQFISFFRDPPIEADEHGRARLKYLDNDLRADLGLERDIVDTRSSKKDVRKILLGSLSPEADESPSDSD
ncbi:Serine/threonine-protein kinase chk1 [Colletotrichum siamense]|uniref:Serine/threonine-protein kinase chk1 n=1 Tax=Colletotrichum siamense TaxID=690259 RepID=UPI001872BB80|nr:Serine/threonine-protein kinase chk1 [Colletotrichum siamense]KAF5489141.1 Serine/threonine-protein kinase chk1 [Colletotrichum siamense]